MTRCKITIAISFILMGILSSCISQKEIQTIQLLQDNQTINILPGQSEVRLKKKTFSFHIYNRKYDSKKSKFYSIQLAAFTNKIELDNISIDAKTDKSKCFSPGTGIAASKNGYYEELIFSNEAHHYLFYEDMENTRLNFIDSKGNYLLFEFPIRFFDYNGFTEEINRSSLNVIYIGIFIDRNLNNIIENDELYKLSLIFE